MPNNNGSSFGYIDLNNYTPQNYNPFKQGFEEFNPYKGKDKQFWLVAYKCLKTKSVGYSFELNNQQILHPFHIVKHDFKLVDIDSRGVNYKCNNCSIIVWKKKGNSAGEIIINNENLVYSCNEYLIKNIIE